MQVLEMIRQALVHLRRDDERGVTTVEYAVMLVLVALAVAAFGAGLSSSVTGVFSRMIAALNSAS